MDKYEYLTFICKDNTGRTPKVPFSAQEIRGTYVLYAADKHCILRVPCSEEDAVRYRSNDPYLTSFFDTMKGLYDGTVFKGQLDALLLKEMAGDPNTETVSYLSLDGAYFSKKVLARALSGWEDTTAVLARSVPKGFIYKGKDESGIKVTKENVHLHPLMLHGKHALLVVAPALVEEGGSEEFPSGAISYNKK